MNGSSWNCVTRFYTTKGRLELILWDKTFNLWGPRAKGLKVARNKHFPYVGIITWVNLYRSCKNFTEMCHATKEDLSWFLGVLTWGNLRIRVYKGVRNYFFLISGWYLEYKWMDHLEIVLQGATQRKEGIGFGGFD